MIPTRDDPDERNPTNENPNLNRRFLYAMLTYVALAVLAVVTLDGLIRIATLVLLGGFALKTYLAVLKSRID
jgi:hypothetical protein